MNDNEFFNTVGRRLALVVSLAYLIIILAGIMLLAGGPWQYLLFFVVPLAIDIFEGSRWIAKIDGSDGGL